MQNGALDNGLMIINVVDYTEPSTMWWISLICVLVPLVGIYTGFIVYYCRVQRPLDKKYSGKMVLPEQIFDEDNEIGEYNKDAAMEEDIPMMDIPKVVKKDKKKQKKMKSDEIDKLLPQVPVKFK